MKQFTKQNLQSLRVDIDNALAAVAEKHGISLKLGNGRFSPVDATFKLELAVCEDGVAMTPEKQILKMLFPDLVDKTVEIDGESAKVVGYNKKARSYPFIVEMKGKRYKVAYETVISEDPHTQLFG